MEYKANFSEQAAADLDIIMGYISGELCNPRAAERFYHLVNEKLSLLCIHPYMYPLHSDERLREKYIRFVSIGNYLMFYIVDDACAIVSVVRILYGRQDIASVFFESGL